MEKCLNKKYKFVQSDEYYEDYLESIGAVIIYVIDRNRWINETIFRLEFNQ